MRQFLIDKEGKVWHADDNRLLEALGYPDPDFELLSYAIRNMGAIGVELGDAATTVRFRALTVSPSAMQAAGEFLASNAIGEITIYSETSEWEEHRFANPLDALRWIYTIPGTPEVRNVVTQSRDVRQIANRRIGKGLDTPEDRLALMFKKWRLTSGKLPHDWAEFLFRFNLLDRSSIASKNSGDTLVWQHMGSAITLYDTKRAGWQFDLQGRPVADQPDKEYGKYADAHFRNALAQGSPALDHVNAVISDGRSTRQFSYDRLLLPWKTETGGDVVTSLSYKTAADVILQS